LFGSYFKATKIAIEANKQQDARNRIRSFKLKNYIMRKKKSLGQHFLIDMSVAEDTANAVSLEPPFGNQVVELGPGTGVLTQYLVERAGIDLLLIELDDRMPELLVRKFPSLENKILHQDFMKVSIENLPFDKFSLVGNFPYNISSQILFITIENRDRIHQMVGMFQKEVAKRICAPHGSKTYGILSVLAQAFFKTEYLFDVPAHSFAPPPKVVSGVIRLERRYDYDDRVDYKKLRRVVKTAFSQRRKKLSNALKEVPINWEALPADLPSLRPDNISLESYILLSNNILVES